MEVDVHTELGMFRASVPSGASTGAYEAVELRDGGLRFDGKGVLVAIKNIHDILTPALLGKSEIEQTEIDNLMLALDGTPNKSKLGANAILGVSLAVAKAGAARKQIPLYQHFADLAGNKELVMPVPSFNVINGGSHAGNAVSNFKPVKLIAYCKLKYFQFSLLSKNSWCYPLERRPSPKPCRLALRYTTL